MHVYLNSPGRLVRLLSVSLVKSDANRPASDFDTTKFKKIKLKLSHFMFKPLNDKVISIKKKKTKSKNIS